MYLSTNLHILHIESHPNWPWEWAYVSKNSSVTTDFVKYYSDKPWDWPRLTSSLVTSSPDDKEFEKKYFDYICEKLQTHLLDDIYKLTISYIFRHKDRSPVT